MSNDLITMLLDKARTEIEQGNALAERWQAANSGINKAIRDAREDENTTDENVRRYQEHAEKLRAALEDARTKIDAYLAEKLGAAQMTDEEKAQVKEQHRAHKTNANTALKFIRDQFGDEGEAAIAAANLPSILGLSGSRSSGGGTGTIRPRLHSVTVNGEEIRGEKTDKEGNVVPYVNMTLVAEHISKMSGTKVGPKELNEALLEECGGDLNSVTDVDFNYSVNGTDYHLVVIPQAAVRE